jgi:hypothetical protein
MGKIVITTTKRAFYFGYGDGGHFLRQSNSWRTTLDPQKDIPGFPWSIELLDTGLLKNRKVPDHPDGRVHSTAGGSPLWIAFFWWDRSGDQRPGSNSGFYVQGFCHNCTQLALDYACTEWPAVAARQPFPLVLQPPPTS